MALYTVYLERPRWEYSSIEVEAQNVDDAQDAALDLINSGHQIYWDFCEDAGDVEIVACELSNAYEPIVYIPESPKKYWEKE